MNSIRDNSRVVIRLFYSDCGENLESKFNLVLVSQSIAIILCGSDDACGTS